ncbi:Lactonase, 7-bladed beta-propeller-domain-containing protein [Flagelloscypha sp. PMI_526]|nr:Lactonase, 7-bladed beta-propeller-domain-containing protein [Flagelloscypha sp. PMI_526]
MVKLNILSGGYDIFIALYSFDTSTSTLSLVNKYPTGTNPSWIGFNANESALYATNEWAEGALQSFDVNLSSGVVSAAVQTVSSGGDSPAHVLALSNGQVSIMNYNGGNGRVVSTIPGHPDQFDDSTGAVIQFPLGPSNVSHPHESFEYKSEILVPDLGGDQIWRLGQDYSTKEWSIKGNVPQSPGSGPRHIVVEDDYIYALHELSSSLTLRKLPPVPSTLTEVSYIANVSIVPDHQPPYARYQAAEIIIPPATSKFPTRYIYVTNRNTNSTDTEFGDSIAIFQHVNKGKPGEKLQLINQFFTGLSQPRGIAFDKTTEYLAAAGVNALGGTRIFKRTDGGKNFTLVAVNSDIETRTGFVWV